MKPFTFVAALEQKVIDPNKIFDCENGKWKLGGKTIRDTHPYRWLSANRVLRYSSNIGTGKIGLSLGAQPLYNYLRAVGFGERTGVSVPSESPGMQPGDALLVAGKGHEPYQLINGVKHPFSDVEAVSRAIREVLG